MLAASGMFKKSLSDLADHVLRGSNHSAMEIPAPISSQHSAISCFQEQKTCEASDDLDVGKHTRVSMLHDCARIPMREYR